MSWELLERFIESEHFNNDPALPVSYLSRYANHIGIQHVLCTKLRQFSYEEIEFFLPQLCHLVISVENESMALEEFILDLCEESVNGALLTFWLFQTHLRDLGDNPQSNLFRTCRRIYNKVQQIIFGGLDPPATEKLQDNVLPVTLLASFVLASIATPFLPRLAGPLAIAQARRPRDDGETIADSTQTQMLTRNNTVSTNFSRNKSDSSKRHVSSSSDALATRGKSRLREQPVKSTFRPQDGQRAPRPASRKATLRPSVSPDPRSSSASLPDTRSPHISSAPNTPLSAGPSRRPTSGTRRHHSHQVQSLTVSALHHLQKVRLLRSNYFRCETSFLTALEDISNRLVVVPKPARLSALRAELGLIAQDLPSEVDIPVICPATLPDGSPRRSKHNRIIRLNPAEATVLNSAERVPYLLLVEVLKEDFDFNPNSEQNERLLAKILSNEDQKRRPFDLSGAPAQEFHKQSIEAGPDSVFEPTSGDLGSSNLIRDYDESDISQINGSLRSTSLPLGSSPAFGSAKRRSSPALPYASNLTDRHGGTLGLRGSSVHLTGSRPSAPEQSDVSALATHMRTAAQMLSQLDSSSSKRPKEEVAAIKAKIIASMQNLEEQNFASEERHLPTFETIMANADPKALERRSVGLDSEDELDLGPTTGVGEARMENDQKTGGVHRKGDRDDPSAAMFGEDWSEKRERVRKSSPYGWMKNWDLLSVIVKTGADLRQEAFACQLIQACDKIFRDAAVPVWVKRMRILVTGESCGLIETITNGVSLHSIKRSLTLANIAEGNGVRGRIATLRDHFVKSFGEPDTETYKAGQAAFIRSLAAYSIVSYVLQLKDRHNGNILIDNYGHIVHIDFGFMLSNSPGSVGFEAAPFKLTQDYVEVMGGVGSAQFEEYKSLCKQAFQALRKSADSIITFVDIMGRESRMPCFSYGVVQATTSLRQRFQLQMSKDEAEQFVETDLIGKSLGSYYTRLYDTFQYRTQGIY